MMFRCTRCLYPNTKPDLHFNKDGLCSACQAFDKRAGIDWPARHDEFMQLVQANRGKTHDVIVACSGGKDSTAQIVKCLELGLRPLAVTATTDHLSKLGRRNLDNISNLCDHIEVTPHKPTRRKISRFALDELGDVSWCEHRLIWSIPAQEAVSRGIPVVLYGEAQNNEYGAGRKGTENVHRLDKAWVDEYGGLLGLRVSDVSEILNIETKHLAPYAYPEGKIHALFMGHFFEWDGYENYKTAVVNGFRPYEAEGKEGDAANHVRHLASGLVKHSSLSHIRTHIEGSLFNYENVDNVQVLIHDAVRYWKFCYTRAIDIASSHIRRGRLTRSEAIELCKKVEGYTPESYLGIPLYDILGQIDMTVDDFQKIAARFMDHSKFEVRDGWPRPKFSLDDEAVQQMQGTEAA